MSMLLKAKDKPKISLNMKEKLLRNFGKIVSRKMKTN